MIKVGEFLKLLKFEMTQCDGKRFLLGPSGCDLGKIEPRLSYGEKAIAFKKKRKIIVVRSLAQVDLF